MSALATANAVTAWFALASALAAVLLALVVLALRPGAPINRILAALLFLESIGFTNGGLAEVYSGRMAMAAAGVFVWFVYPLIGPLYLLFVAHALPRPSTKWLRTPIARRSIFVVAPLLWLLAHLIDPSRAPDTKASWLGRSLLLSVSLFALGTAIVHRRGTSGARRRKATAYLVAFGALDIGFISGLGMTAWLDVSGGITTASNVHILQTFADMAIVAGSTVFLLALSYGMLRSQILDFSFKLHKGISRSTMAAVFVGVFFVVSELAAELLSEQVGPIAGILATGLLVFALAPLQRFGDRVGSAVVDDARSIDERSAIENEQLFRDQVELAFEDGQLTIKEVRMLEQIRNRLGVDAERAIAIQNAVVAPRQKGQA